MKINPGWGSRPVSCKKRTCPTAEDSQALGTVQEQGGQTGSYVRARLILWYAKHAELSWEGDVLKNNLRSGIMSRLVFKGILEPNKQLVGLFASLDLQTPWPEEANALMVTLNVARVRCSGMPLCSGCHLVERMLGVNFHSVFIWQMQGEGWGGRLLRCQQSGPNY